MTASYYKNLETPQARGESVAAYAQVTDSAHRPAGSADGRRRHSSVLGRRHSSVLGRRSSALLSAICTSFSLSRGQSGTSVGTLRGDTGADFEGYAIVHRGVDDRSDRADAACTAFGIPDSYCSSNGLHYLLVKGRHCFIFDDEYGKSPMYAIELTNRRTVLQSSQANVTYHPGASPDATSYSTIHLETGQGDVEYTFTFANIEDGQATKFCNAVSAASNKTLDENAQRSLGREILSNNNRRSVRLDNMIGVVNVREQPGIHVEAEGVCL